MDGCRADEGQDGVLIDVAGCSGVIFTRSGPEATALEQAQDAGADGVEEARDVLGIELRSRVEETTTA